jgi:hypothetical protein
MNGEAAVLFREDQRFRSPWLALMVGVAALFGLASGLALIVWQVMLGHPFGNKPLPDALALFIGVSELAVVFSIVWLMWAAVLQIEVTNRGLFVRFYPFHRKTRQIDLDGVIAVYAATYRPIREYGGWGVRVGRRSRCYNVSGEEGVRIEYANGFHVMLGTQRAEELEAAIQRIWQAPAQDHDSTGAENA